MLLSRLAFISANIMSSTSCFQFLFIPPENTNNAITQQQRGHPPLVAAYHEPPPHNSNSNDDDDDTTNDDYYANNPTVFGRILDGKIPSRTYLESKELLAFRDISPHAPLHDLVIPKRHVRNVYSLRGISRHSEEGEGENESQDNNDIQLVQNMRQMGLDLLEQHQPKSLASGDYILCFHIPPFYSVDHLHLHVLAPASEMNWVYREIKYKCGARWCTSDLEVIERLKAGLPAVQYKRLF